MQQPVWRMIVRLNTDCTWAKQSLYTVTLTCPGGWNYASMQECRAASLHVYAPLAVM